jgi:hypothetical protein
MCFIVELKHSDHFIAKKDIVCYKILNEFCRHEWIDDEPKTVFKIVSPFKGFTYELNNLYKLFSPLMEINNGFSEHTIQEGFHSYTKLRIAKNITHSNCESVFKCIIPKGSEYYVNDLYNEYVSNQIIIKEKIRICA